MQIQAFAFLAAGGGFDPLAPQTFGQALWTLLIFGLSIPAIWIVVMKPIVAALEARDDHAKQAIGAAEEAKAEAERVRAEVEVSLGEARAESAREMAEARERGEKRAAEIINDAEKKAREEADAAHAAADAGEGEAEGEEKKEERTDDKKEEAENPLVPEGQEEAFGKHPVENDKSYWKPGTGLTMSSEDGRFMLATRLRMQLRYAVEAENTEDEDNEGEYDTEVSHMYQIRRARLQFKAHAWNPHNKMKVEFAFSPRDLSMKDGVPAKDGRFTPVSWETAFDVMAAKFKEAYGAGGPAAIGLFGSGQYTIDEGYAAAKLWKAGFRSNNIDPNARHCMASAVAGFIQTFGIDEPAGCYDDIELTDAVVTWGANMAECHPILWSRVTDRKLTHKATRVINLSTYSNRCSDLADLEIIFEPQTDLAILNYIGREMVTREGAIDQEFVEKHCIFATGFTKIGYGLEDDHPAEQGQEHRGKAGGHWSITFAEFKRSLEPYTAEYTSELSGVPVEKLEELADLYCDRSKKVVSFWTMGFNQHTRGTWVNEQMYMVHLLGGKMSKPGSGAFSLTGQPSACGTAREVGCLAHLMPGGRLIKVEAHRKDAEERWNLPEGRINPVPGTHTVKMFEEFCTEGGSVDTIWVQVTNPAQSLPNTEKLFYNKDNCSDKFLIVSDVYPTETTRNADLVLPSALWVEKNGVFGNSERRTQQWFKMVEPPEGARDDAWQVLAVARRMHDMGFAGMKDKDGKFLFEILDFDGNPVEAWKWENYYGDNHNVDRFLYEDYRPWSHMKHKNVAPYDALVATRGMRWPVVEQPDGSWQETRWRFVEGLDPFVEKGKGIDFYQQVLDFDDRDDLPRANGVWDMGTAEAAEMAKLAETTYRDVNIGLANQDRKSVV